LYSPVPSSGVVYSLAESPHGLTSSLSAANTGVASASLISAVARTNMRSPDHCTRSTPRSLNLASNAAAASCCCLGVVAPNRGVRIMMPRTVTLSPLTSSSHDISETSKPSAPAAWSASRTLVASGLTYLLAAALSLKA
jgi:hypothetical protein